MDAVVHASVDDRRYNGRSTADVYDGRGLSFGSIMAMSPGIITRGVLLDVAVARGVESLEAGEGVTLDDIHKAEVKSGVQVREGDAVFVRSGIGQDEHWATPAGPNPAGAPSGGNPVASLRTACRLRWGLC